MIHNNKVYGGPLVMFAAVKDDVESLIAYGGSYPAGAIAYASDTNQIGWYDGTYWHWFGGSADEVATDTTNFSGVLSSTDIDIQEALDTLDDHFHDGRYYTESEVDSAIDADISTHAAVTDAHHSRYTDTEAVAAVAADDAYYTKAETDAAIDADISTHVADDDAHHAVFIQEDIDTLAELNAIVTDATLDDSSDPRDPNAHALSHQHGGSDEIATATPAANAIPKADASGTLNAWLSGAGSGDMTKAVYDTDDDGVVDNAEALGGVAAANYLTTTTGYTQTNLSTSGGASVHWDNLTNVPTEFTPSQHGIVSATYHSVTGSAFDVIGLSASDTLAVLTPSADVSAGTEALLKSDASGYLKTAAFVLPDEGWVGNSNTTARLLFDSSNGRLDAILGDAAGADEFRVVDSGGTAVATIDSNGNAYLAQRMAVTGSTSSAPIVIRASSTSLVAKFQNSRAAGGPITFQVASVSGSRVFTFDTIDATGAFVSREATIGWDASDSVFKINASSTINDDHLIVEPDGNVGVNEADPAISDGVGIHIGGKILRLDTSKSPASNGTGNVGEICWDGNYIYVCTATNTWKRVALTGGY